MARMSIELLPTESLVRIFAFLADQDLVNAALTCKKFNQVIIDYMPGRYPSITIDFQHLNYNKVQRFMYRDRDFNCLLETNRLYQNYRLINFNKEHTDRLGNKWLQLFKKQISARCIRIKADCMDLRQLSNLIRLTHRLVYIEIDGYRIAKLEEPLDEKDHASLPALAHLKIHSFMDASPQIFKIFHDCKTLKTISLSSLFFINKKIKSINDFILHQRALEQLELIGLDSHSALFNYEHLNDIKFKLKKLNIEFNGYSFNLEKFSAFFCRQKALKEVKMSIDLRNSANQAHDEKLCDAMIRHMMTLDHLASLNLLVNKCSLSETETFNYNNKSITKLVFENESRGRNDLLIGILRSLQNLVHLELACDFSDDVLAQLQLIQSLKHLKITDYFQGLLKSVRCVDTLESISLQYCYTKHSGGDWLDFLTNHPKIKRIHIHHSIDFIDDTILDIITGACPGLEYFAMTDSTAKGLTEDAYRIVQKNCVNLKFLKLVEKPCPTTVYKHQSLHDLLANVKCVISFYIICIIALVALVVLMWQGKI